MSCIKILRAVVLCGLTIGLAGLPVRAVAAPRVVVSLKPLHSIAAAVMEGAGEPELLLPGAAATPHGYSLKPSQMRALSRADLVFWVGAELETFLGGPLAGLPDRVQVISLLETTRLAMEAAGRRGADRPASGAVLWTNRTEEDRDVPRGPVSSGQAADPHIWLDPVNAVAIADAMAAHLGDADPSHAELYRANARRFRARMQELQERVETRLAPVRDRPFIVYHDSYQYLERRFGLRAVGAVTRGAHINPGAAHLARLRAMLMDGEAVCIFVEPQFSPRIARALVRGTPARLGTLDPLGGDLPQGAESYPALIDNLARALLSCLAPVPPVRAE